MVVLEQVMSNTATLKNAPKSLLKTEQQKSL
jgi:hypothetical protein